MTRKRNAIACVVSGLTALLAGGSVRAASLVELAVEDTFAYQRFPTFNFGAGTYAVAPWNLATIMAAGRTTTNHNTEGYLRFDVTDQRTLLAGETAKLRLYVRSSQTVNESLIPTFGADPVPATPVTVNARAVTASWAESTLTWNNKATAGPVLASTLVDGINKWVEFDVTDQVNAWIANPSSNFGFNLEAAAVVRNSDDTAFVTPVFQSSSQANPPQLVLNYIPEPMTASVAMGMGGLLLARRRGR